MAGEPSDRFNAFLRIPADPKIQALVSGARACLHEVTLGALNLSRRLLHLNGGVRKALDCGPKGKTCNWVPASPLLNKILSNKGKMPNALPFLHMMSPAPSLHINMAANLHFIAISLHPARNADKIKAICNCTVRGERCN